MLLRRYFITYCAIIGFSGLALIPLNEVTAQENAAPIIRPIPTQYVLEGEILITPISAYDLDGDAIYLDIVSGPSGLILHDNSDGTGYVTWQPGFVGPYSSHGSPFEVAIRAGDGNAADLLQ